MADRVAFDLGDPARGPTLVCVGSMHGNEPSGAAALMLLASLLGSHAHGMPGRVVGLRGNLAALDRNERFIDHDLNRLWGEADRTRIAAMDAGDRNREETQLIELCTLIDGAIASAGERGVFVIDMHSTSAPLRRYHHQVVKRQLR